MSSPRVYQFSADKAQFRGLACQWIASLPDSAEPAKRRLTSTLSNERRRPQYSHLTSIRPFSASTARDSVSPRIRSASSTFDCEHLQLKRNERDPNTRMSSSANNLCSNSGVAPSTKSSDRKVAIKNARRYQSSSVAAISPGICCNRIPPQCTAPVTSFRWLGTCTDLSK